MTTINPLSGSSLQGSVENIKQQAASGDFQMPTEGGGDMQYYLNLMQEMQAESRAFTTFSNILTTRHQAAQNAIRNIRG
ncbi:MAG TPA: hypothetical protein VMT16_04485 [Thermoanaerobaculia bacterium]|nr:hypothetical protein [Thermoanaerobaculia bacterium]